MRLTEILTERVQNAFDVATKEKYAEQVWNVLQLSYKNISGGFGTASSIEELIEKSGLWKIVTRNGQVTAVNIYRDQHGRKSIASGTDGTSRGKKDFAMLKNDDIKLNRSWAEVSGAVERMLAKFGAKAIPAKFAPFLTGREILSYNDDGVHYTRLIAGHPHEKVMYGIVNIDQAMVQKLAGAGIQIHDLPDNFRKT